LRQRHLRRDRRRIAKFDDLARQWRGIAGGGLGQCLDVSRVMALPFELVHEAVCIGARQAARNRFIS